MLTLTKEAADKVRELMKEMNKEGHGLRVFAYGGG